MTLCGFILNYVLIGVLVVFKGYLCSICCSTGSLTGSVFCCGSDLISINFNSIITVYAGEYCLCSKAGVGFCPVPCGLIVGVTGCVSRISLLDIGECLAQEFNSCGIYSLAALCAGRFDNCLYNISVNELSVRAVFLVRELSESGRCAVPCPYDIVIGFNEGFFTCCLGIGSCLSARYNNGGTLSICTCRERRCGNGTGNGQYSHQTGECTLGILVSFHSFFPP